VLSIKSLTIFDHYTFKENNATKSLIDLLRHSDPDLTKLFIRDCLRIAEFSIEKALSPEYRLQITEKLQSSRGCGLVVAICDNKQEGAKKHRKSDEDKSTIPDALIQFGNITILIEAKVDGYPINSTQIQNHQKRLSADEHILQTVYTTWQEIHSFFNRLVEYKWNTLTVFLLHQYLNYCEHMGFSYEKKPSYILAHFINRPKVLHVIQQIDDYLKSLPHVHCEEDITDCFGYKILNQDNRKSRKFFSSSKYKNGTYILHLTNKELVMEYQERVNLQFPTNKKSVEKPTEVHIRMDTIEDVSQVKEYLDLAYNERLKNFLKRI
jgi:hypothetical protein